MTKAQTQIVYILKRKKIFNEVAFDYSDEFKAELDRRMEDYRSGKAKMITAEESKEGLMKFKCK